MPIRRTIFTAPTQKHSFDRNSIKTKGPSDLLTSKRGRSSIDVDMKIESPISGHISGEKENAGVYDHLESLLTTMHQPQNFSKSIIGGFLPKSKQRSAFNSPVSLKAENVKEVVDAFKVKPQ